MSLTFSLRVRLSSKAFKISNDYQLWIYRPVEGRENAAKNFLHHFNFIWLRPYFMKVNGCILIYIYVRYPLLSMKEKECSSPLS